ncbi:HlyD family secretion protein [Massilia sp. DWR3-1-1]|uniref:HlyD family secretion protein n=1 Tax=Massilia sp. DWR3-1-1 TaxID=2804559 RepID=UPI003CFB7B32
MKAPLPADSPRRKVVLSALIFGGIAVAGVLVVLYAWNLPPFHSTIQSTENALVRGQVTIISPQLSGYVVDVAVQDFQPVRQGALIMRLDDRIYQQKVEQASAQLAAARSALANSANARGSAEATIRQGEAAVANADAQAARAAADVSRVEELAADGSLSARERDSTRAARAQSVAGGAQARAALEIARQGLQTVTVGRGSLEAAVANAEAVLKLAQIELSNTRVLAPRDGQLGQVTVRQGGYVNAGAQVTAIVPEQLWVIANMKETQMARIAIGQPASLRIDAFDNARLNGHVERISPATGSEFSVLTPDNATGNYVKIAQRIPVRISIDPQQALAGKLRPGMSVVVNIDTAPGPSRPAAQP